MAFIVPIHHTDKGDYKVDEDAAKKVLETLGEKAAEFERKAAHWEKEAQGDHHASDEGDQGTAIYHLSQCMGMVDDYRRRARWLRDLINLAKAEGILVVACPVCRRGIDLKRLVLLEIFFCDSCNGGSRR